ncbi:hypothetical protein D3C71_1752510 [compost metagenome]
MEPCPAYMRLGSKSLAKGNTSGLLSEVAMTWDHIWLASNLSMVSESEAPVPGKNAEGNIPGVARGMASCASRSPRMSNCVKASRFCVAKRMSPCAMNCTSFVAAGMTHKGPCISMLPFMAKAAMRAGKRLPAAPIRSSWAVLL